MPGTWAGQGVDANHDGTALPTDSIDAIAAQGHYDCALAADLAGAPGDRQDTISYRRAADRRAASARHARHR